MPNLTTYGGDPYPTGPEGAFVPGDMMAYAESVDPKLVHSATSVANRDATYAGLPAGKIVTCPLLKSVWMSLGGSPTQWLTLASDTGWVSTGFAYPSAAYEAGDYARVRTVSGTTEVRVAAHYIGATFTTGATGDISDNTICTIPSAFRPPAGLGEVQFTGIMSGGILFLRLGSPGNLFAHRGTPNHTYETGSDALVSATYLAG